MDYNEVAETTDTDNIRRIRKEFFDHTRVFDRESGDKVIQYIIREGSEDFSNYIDWLGVSKDPKLIILASNHHYYYDNNELREVKNIIHLRQLNNVKNLRDFMHSVFRLLPEGASFIGCFTDTNLRKGKVIDNYRGMNGSFDPYENGVSSRSPFFSFIYNLFDQKTSSSLTRKDVMLMLADNRFRLLDMTELNGITYFCAQKEKAGTRSR